MIEFYPEIRLVHIVSVLLSGGLFLLRGLWLLSGRERWAKAAPLRWLVYSNDTVLLTAALMLTTILRQYPFAQPWLTVKVLMLLVYIVLGALAFHGRARPATRWLLFLAALAVYGFIISVARAHHPLGIFSALP